MTMRSPAHLSSLLPLLLVLILPRPAVSWGSLGHRTVAYLGSLHFSPAAHRLTNTLLHAQDISQAALFPDKVVHLPSFAYSAPWHYIDAHDDPHHGHCGINVTRDCLDEGCIVRAIANHTGMVRDAGLEAWKRGQALRFLLHWLGDVHQPLHTEAEERGGNEIAVVFEGRKSNLHSVWDTLIPNKLAGGSIHHRDGDAGNMTEEEAAMAWALRLYAADTKEHAEDDCIDLDDAVGCALEWAGEANRWVCEYVLKEDITGDLAEEYYVGAILIVEDAITKGGRRLGAWINRIADELLQADGAIHVQEL